MRWIRFQSKVLYDTEVHGQDVDENPDLDQGGQFVAELFEAQLPARGFAVNFVVREVWGWCVSLDKSPGYSQWVGCQYCFDERGDYGLQCFVEPDKPVIRRWFRSINIEQRTTALKQAIEEILRESGEVDGIYWSDEPY